MATSIQEFAKDNGYRMHQAKNIIKKTLGNLPDTLSDEDLAQISSYSNSEDESKALPPAPKQKQLPTATTLQEEEPMDNSQLATTEESAIADSPLPKNLQPHQLAAFERFLQAEEITITGTQDAIEDRELYLSTYEKTIADLRIDSVKSTITRIKTNKQEFLKRQAERKQTTEGKLAEDAQFIAENQQWLTDFKAQNAIIF